MLASELVRRFSASAGVSNPRGLKSSSRHISNITLVHHYIQVNSVFHLGILRVFQTVKYLVSIIHFENGLSFQ